MRVSATSPNERGRQLGDRTRSILVLAVMAAFVVVPAGAWAQEAGDAAHQKAQAMATAGENQASGDTGGEAERRNEVALLLGGTYEEEENYFTFGFEYQRTFRLTQFRPEAIIVPIEQALPHAVAR